MKHKFTMSLQTVKETVIGKLERLKDSLGWFYNNYKYFEKYHKTQVVAIKDKIFLDKEVKRRTKELEDSNRQLLLAIMKLERDNEQLKVHDKMQKEFINVAAHELRAPVQPILALTEQLREKIKNKDQVQLLDVVIRNAQRLKNISEDILDATKFESNSLRLTKEKCSLNQLIFKLVTEFQNNLETDKKIKFVYNANNYAGGGGPILINADKNRISQVISNLICNSVKFIKKEGTISVAIERRKTYDRDNKEVAVVVIKDTGSGIDDEMFPKLFKKFATKSFQGTGLGLYICKNIVESHGGKIWAENNKDEKGSTFSFCLPLE